VRILVTGATGYIGSGVVRGLLNGFNHVTGTCRNAERAAPLVESGMELRQVGLEELDALERLAADHDVVVHAAASCGADRQKLDEAATAALLRGAAGGRTEVFVYTSGVWVLGPTGDAWAADDWPLTSPSPAAAWRSALEPQVRAASSPRLRTHVVRPGIVYGGEGGIIGGWMDEALAGRPIRIVGGLNRWPLVHQDDLAGLYARVIDAGSPGAAYNATDETAHTVLEIAGAIARAAGGIDVLRWPVEQAREALGAVADALAMDQRVKSPAARKLGWQPRHADLLLEADRVYDEHVAQPQPS
jgi:nucleoside-diphosphate-sugar epimerase